MYVDDIIKCVNKEVKTKDSIEELDKATYCIVLAAYEHSIDKDYESPYSKSKKNKDDDHKGGRPDDLTAVAAMVETHHSDHDI